MSSTPERASQIVPGTYRLRTAVENPKPDRRAHQSRLESWHQWAVWPAGTVFIVELNPEIAQPLPPYLLAAGVEPPVRLRTYVRHGYQSCAISSHLPWHQTAWNLLTAAMEPMTEQPSDYLVRREGSCAGSRALEILDRCGLSVADLERILAEIEADEEGVA